MAPKITVKYFDIRGRAEPIRLALLLGDIAFTDDRMPFGDWQEVKPTTPFGSLPTVTVDGEVFAQSIAALRYAGKLSGLYPEDAVAALRVDMVMDTVSDMTQALFAGRGEAPEKQKALREKAVAESVPRYFGALDKILAAWGAGPFVTGDKVTVADLVVCEAFNNVKQGKIDHVPTDALDKFERLHAAFKAVHDIPAVKDWYKKYPIPGVTA